MARFLERPIPMSNLVLLASADPAFNLLAARWQMALTLGSHIVLAVFGIGMPVLLLTAEWRYRGPATRSGKPWPIAGPTCLPVLFAVGAISGTVLSFGWGCCGPSSCGSSGPVIGFAFAMEVCLFLEAIFVGIYLYGWNRLPKWVHWWCGVPIAISGAASAWFVVTVSSWMSTPRGFRLVDGHAVDIDPLAALLNPSTGPQTVHMLVAAYIVAGFIVAAVYAWSLLVDGTCQYSRRAGSGLTMGVMMPVQFVVGDWAARRGQEQPIKLAALEGQFHRSPRFAHRRRPTRRPTYAIGYRACYRGSAIAT
jgi:cytochrome d ubiquinol oxidase subunit I